jgi:hypothetical protein
MSVLRRQTSHLLLIRTNLGCGTVFTAACSRQGCKQLIIIVITTIIIAIIIIYCTGGWEVGTTGLNFVVEINPALPEIKHRFSSP